MRDESARWRYGRLMGSEVRSVVALAALLMALLILGGTVAGLTLGSGKGDPLLALRSFTGLQIFWSLVGTALLVVVLASVLLYLAANHWVSGREREIAQQLSRLVGKPEEHPEGATEAENSRLDALLSAAARRLLQAQQEAEELERLRDLSLRRDRSSQVLHDIIKQINSSLEISQLRVTTLNALRTALNVDFTAFLWIDPHDRTATLERVGRETGADRTLQHQLAALPPTRAELSKMLERWQPWNWVAVRLENPGWQALAADLIVSDHFAGVLVALRAGEWPFSQEEEQTFGIVLENLQVALENARLYELAIRDELTGLFTRRYFEQRAEQEFSRCHRLRVPLSLVMIDLNYFKSVNDQLGHLTGDQLLAEVGKVISSSVRNFDLPVRYGGDEFLLLLPNANTEQARLVAERVRRNFERIPPPRLRGSDQMGVSYGIATYPDDGGATGELVRLADQRMYQDKFESRVVQPAS